MDQVNNVLVSLYPGYGLGDAVQVSVVLQHLRKHKPHWVIDYQAEDGRHQIGRGVATHTFARGQPYPTPHYDAEIQLVLYDRWPGFTDRPNTHITACLRDCCGLSWDAACGRYRVDVSKEAHGIAQIVVSPNATRMWGSRGDTVAVHYQGDSAKENKDLTHDQANEICRAIERSGATPLLLDWRNTSPLSMRDNVRSTGKASGLTLLNCGGDAEINCAIISQCAAFVGIDSGPAKCAGATNTPALVIWTRHHPAQFYDPAPNVTHLMPRGHRLLNGDDVPEWFWQNYRVRFYDGNPIVDVTMWLTEVLHERQQSCLSLVDSDQ